MTENEWLSSRNPQRMLRFLRSSATDRQFRLFALYLCQQNSASPAPPELNKSLAFVDQWLTHSPSEAQRAWAEEDAYNALQQYPPGQTPSMAIAAWELPGHSAYSAANAISLLFQKEAEQDHQQERHCRLQCEILRELVGNPFRPVQKLTLPHGSPTEQMALWIHRNEDFELLPVLGDALQDSGCTDETMLDHCYQPGAHRRGCWVLEEIVSRSGTDSRVSYLQESTAPSGNNQAHCSSFST